MDGSLRVTLPGGWWADGARINQASVSPLVGTDEVALLDHIGRLPAPQLTTRILARCVADDGDTLLDEEVVRGLSVGDREALLWHLRRLTLGDAVDATVSCADCDEKASIQLSVDQLLHSPYESWAPVVGASIDEREIEFRVPTGADQERVARSRLDPATGAIEILKACVLSIDGAPPTEADLGALVGGLSSRMAELDPQAETLLETSCPSCGALVVAELDAGAFLFEEVAIRSRYLFAEIHVLASNYHWSERDILSMTADRRRTYLDLIEATRTPAAAP